MLPGPELVEVPARNLAALAVPLAALTTLLTSLMAFAHVNLLFRFGLMREPALPVRLLFCLCQKLLHIRTGLCKVSSGKLFSLFLVAAFSACRARQGLHSRSLHRLGQKFLLVLVNLDFVESNLAQ